MADVKYTDDVATPIASLVRLKIFSFHLSGSV